MRFFLLLMVLLLTGCGFHLRGQTTLAPPLHRLYLQSKDPYGPLAQSLKQYLKISGVQLTDNACVASAVLDILGEQEIQQLLTVSGTQQTRQYNLILSATFQVTDPQGKVLVPPQTVSETRALTLQANQILADSNELITMYQLMRRAVVFDIMNRLSSVDVTNLLIKK